MKKIISFLFIAACTAGFVACSDDDSDEPALKIVKSDIEFPASGGDGTIEIISPGNVTAKPDRDWITITNEMRDKVTFTVNPNQDMLNRTSTITISYGAESQEVAITQSGAIFSTEGLDGQDFSAESGVYEFEFYSNTDLTVSSNQSWVDPSYSDGKLTLTIYSNPTISSRTATITVAGGWKEETFTITQRAVAP